MDLVNLETHLVILKIILHVRYMVGMIKVMFYFIMKMSK